VGGGNGCRYAYGRIGCDANQAADWPNHIGDAIRNRVAGIRVAWIGTAGTATVTHARIETAANAARGRIVKAGIVCAMIEWDQ
jgi:hypothetical protein